MGSRTHDVKARRKSSGSQSQPLVVDSRRALECPERIPDVKLPRGPILLIALAALPAAHADSATIVTGSLGGTSDFVFRGLSLTRGKPAAQGSIDVEFPREFYIGAFAATCDPNRGPSPDLEVDMWAGRYWRVSEDFSPDFPLSQYTHPDDPPPPSYNPPQGTRPRRL